MIRYPYNIATTMTDLKLGGSCLIVETISSGYFSVSGGLLTFNILEIGGEYEVHPECQSSENPQPILVTDMNTLYYKIHRDNAYEKPEWLSQDITGLVKEQELLKAFKAVVDSKFTFGGPAPYTSFSNGIYLETILYEALTIDDYIEKVTQNTISDDVFYVVDEKATTHNTIVAALKELGA